MSEVTLRELRAEDLSAIAALLRESFDPQLWPFMTYTQPGIVEFMSISLKYPGTEPDRHRLVSRSTAGAKNLVGFADFRVLDKSVGFLSYIAVRPEARGTGVATRLIEKFVSDNPQLTELRLDVFDDNEGAVALYSKLGFLETSAAVWITRDLPEPRGTVEIRSLAMSLAGHRAFGFCELDVFSPRGECRIGLLGSVLRCFAVESFENEELLSGLAELFPEVNVAFAVVPEVELREMSVDFSIQKVARRMTLKLNRPKGLGRRK